MEASSSSPSSPYLFILISIPCVLVLSWIVKLVCSLYSLWWKPKRLEKYLHGNGIKGPSYKFMYGNMKEMMELSKEVKSKSIGFTHDIVVNPFLQKMKMQYGKVFVTWMGTSPEVTVMDQILIKEMLLNKSGDFVKMETTPSSKLFVTGLASYDGEKWAKHRRIINPAFHTEKLKQILSTFSICCDEVIEKWNKLVTTTGSCEVDVCPEFETLTGNVISRAAFGSSYEEGRRVFQLQVEQAKLFIREYHQKGSIFASFWPAKVNPRRVEIYEEVRTILKGIIKKKEKAIEMGDSVNDDLLGLLMESNLNESRESGSSKKLAMSIDDVMEECKLFYFAGQETTAKLLTWTMILLSMHSSWQDRARDEVLRVMGKNKPKFDDLQHLKIVNMIFLEVLRLYPPTPIMRRTRKKTKLGEFSLPSNIQIKIPLLLVHRDPEQWGDDVNEFNPNRFSEGVAKASKDQMSYYPFGWGPRICIGQNFALLEAKMVLAKILQQFYFELSPSYTHSPSVTITLGPEYGAQIILHKL